MTVSPSSSSPDSAEIRVGAIGCGGRLAAHAAGIAAAGGVRLVAAFDIDETNARAASDAYDAIPYTDLGAMLSAERLDAVTIVTPPWVRTSVVEPAIAAGMRAILIEKPISLLPSEAHALVAASDGRLVAANTQYQWMPHWRALWPRIAAGELGEVHTIRCSTWADAIEQGPHTMDLSVTLARHAGLPAATSVTARGWGSNRYPRGERMPSNLDATFELGDARLTCIHGDVAPLVPGETDGSFPIQVEAIGTKGRVWVSLTQGWRLFTEAGGWESGPTSWEDDDHSAQTAVFADIRDRLNGGGDGTTFPTSIERAATNQDMLFGAVVACLTGEAVDLTKPIDESALSDDALWARLGAERVVA